MSRMDKSRRNSTENDEEIARLERQLKELKEAHEQSAATIAVDYRTRSFSPPRRLGKSFSKMNIILTMFFLLAIGITSVVIWFNMSSNFKQETVTFVENVQELATLATAEAQMKTVIHEEGYKVLSKNIPINLPGTKRELLLIVPGTVIAGVDLKGITSKDMVINKETNEIDIHLPHAKLIQVPALKMDEIQAISNSGIFSGDVKWDEGLDKVAQAQEQMRQEAISTGLLDTAEKNAEKVLKEFFKNVGYTVNVTFN